MNIRSIIIAMDILDQLSATSEFMACEDSDEQRPAGAPLPDCYTPSSPGNYPRLPVFHAKLGGGKTTPLLKTVLTSACERNCVYCAFRSGRDFRRHTFKPDDLADAFMRMAQAGEVKGLFLSSGVAGGGERTQDRLIDTAEILRNKRGFQGYLHLKIMPGAERGQIERAMQLADRVSVNLEAPTGELLNRLAPQKDLLDELLRPLRVVEEIRRSQPGEHGWKGRWPSSTTQFVVGAVGDTDRDLLRATAYLYRKLRLTRAYYSGFHPVDGTPLENHAPENPWRTYRLYQASFLLRDYGFDLEDLPLNNGGSLPIDQDPKLVWARVHLGETPVEVNRAGLEDLLRVPGIGPKGARAIVAARRKSRLLQIEDLEALGIRTRRVAPFILLAGKRPVFQMSLW